MSPFGQVPKRFWGGILTIFLFVSSVGGCSRNGNDSSGSGSVGDLDSGLVYLSFPDETEERWTTDAEIIRRAVEAEGYQFMVKFAANDVVRQTSDIENAIITGARVIIVAAIDSFAVGPALEKAYSQGIRILAYDQFVTDTRAVDYYLGFQPKKIGEVQAKYIIEYLRLERGEIGPFNVELFAGDASPNWAEATFAGAWDLLQPYFADGRLVSQSGKVNANLVADDWQNITILPWTLDATSAAMEERLTNYLALNLKLDAILSPSDSITQGIINFLSGSSLGWTPGDGNWPAITGQDASGFGLYNISEGFQGQTVWKDSRILAARAAEICLSLLRDETIEPVERVNNGIIEVPTIWLDPVSVTKRGVKDAKSTVSVQGVIDSGYITENQIQPFQ
jgi:putative multiple sugar transport system substrate-binding protein